MQSCQPKTVLLLESSSGCPRYSCTRVPGIWAPFVEQYWSESSEIPAHRTRVPGRGRIGSQEKFEASGCPDRSVRGSRNLMQ
eukprot:2592054-Rhodomonas_salina.1